MNSFLETPENEWDWEEEDNADGETSDETYNDDLEDTTDLESGGDE
ncbi:MAG: hypothetical protein R3A44_30875 [Caldilineaceae bacterium]